MPSSFDFDHNNSHSPSRRPTEGQAAFPTQQLDQLTTSFRTDNGQLRTEELSVDLTTNEFKTTLARGDVPRSTHNVYGCLPPGYNNVISLSTFIKSAEELAVTIDWHRGKKIRCIVQPNAYVDELKRDFSEQTKMDKSQFYLEECGGRRMKERTRISEYDLSQVRFRMERQRGG